MVRQQSYRRCLCVSLALISNLFLLPTIATTPIALEVAIKQEPNLSSIPTDRIKGWKDALLRIIERGSISEPSETGSTNESKNTAINTKRIHSIQDRVATMVRKAAVSKATRLLSDLDLISETT